MSKIVVTGEVAKHALSFISSIEGRSAPDFEGTVIANEGDDVSNINELPIDTVSKGKLVYFDEGSGRAFAVLLEDCKEKGDEQ